MKAQTNYKLFLSVRFFLILLPLMLGFIPLVGQTNCPGPWPTSGGIGQPGNWIVIGNTSNGNDPATGYGNVSYQYSYLDRFVRLNEYVTFLNAVDPGGSGNYVGNLVNFGMIQYSGGSWQVAPFTSCSPETGQSMTAAQTAQIALTLVSFNHMARFCNWLTTGSVSSGPYTFSSSSANATPTSVNINYPNSVRMPTEDEFYKAAYYRASNGSWQEYGTQAGNLSGGEPIVSGVSSTGNINISNGHLYNQSFHWHPSFVGSIACLWQMRAGQGGQSYYNLYNMVGGFHHYLTAGGSSTTMVLRPQNQVQGGAPEQSRNFRLTGADRAEHYASPSLHLVYYGNACCPIAGTPSNLSVCNDNFTSINLFSQLTDESTGGTWTRTAGTGGTFNAAAGTFLPDATTSATSTFRYTIAASGTCAASTADVTITIITKRYAGTGGSATECTNSGTVVSLASLLTGADTGGTWTRLTGTGGTFTAAAGTYTITSTATTSTFRYRVTNTAPCTTSDAVVTVNVVSAPTAGTGSTVSRCDNNTTAINLFTLLTGEDTGGTWTRTSGTGGTFDAGAGTFTPAIGATSSTFNYMVGGGTCPVDNEAVTVNISPQANTGTGGSTTDCAGTNNTIDLFSLLTDEQSGGAWTRVSGTGGTFTAGAGTFVTTSTATTSVFRYTVTEVAPCVNSTADVTVNVTGAPTSGTGSSTTVCDNSVAAINLYNLLTGEDIGGTWSRTSGTGGTFNAGAGTYTPAAGATTSTFNYMVGGGGCPEDNESVTVNITPQAEAGTGGSITDCAGTNNTITLSTLITGGQSGGTWTRLTGTGGTFTGSTTGTYVVTSTATTSTFRYTVAGTAPCLADIADVTVNVTGAPTAGTGSSTTVCDNSTAPINLNNLLTGEDTGGTWTRTGGTGGTFDAGAGTYTPAAGATTSTFNYMVGGGGCPVDNETVTVNITPQANAGVATSVTDCAGSNTSIDLFSLLTGEQTGGVWTRLTGSGGTFTAGAGTFVITSTAITSTFRYTVTGTAPCVNNMADVTVNVTAAPMSGTGSTMSICDDSTTPINLYNMLTGEDAGGTWTRVSGTGGTFVAATGNFTPALGATSSTFRYTNGGGGCPIDTEDVTVNITPRAYAGLDGTSEGCEGGGIVINLFDAISGEQTGGIWTRLTGTSGVFNDAAGTYALTTGADNSTFQYTVSGTAPCTDDSAIATVTVTGSCCVINSVVLSNLVCIDNGTPNKITDNRIRFSMMVTNQNPLLSIYNVSVNGGTTITPTSGQYGVGTLFTLGPGTAGGMATFIVTITDATIAGCTSTINVTDPGNCSSGTGDCPPVKCGTATIQVNGN